jgi:hypothetical protein
MNRNISTGTRCFYMSLGAVGRVAGVFVVAGLLVLLMLVSAVAAPADQDDLGRAECSKSVDTVKRQLAHVTLLGNVFTLLGAGVAALGSIAAGATSGKKSIIAGAVGVAGAIVSALPKTLPDRAVLQAKISLADQHRIHGEKTIRELPFLHDEPFVVECRKYAVARFIDCSADEPSKEVPELPSATRTLVSSAPVVVTEPAVAKSKRPHPERVTYSPPLPHRETLPKPGGDILQPGL